MKTPNREEQRQIIRQWEATGRALERIRREELRGKPYDWEEVDALLEIGAAADIPERTESGLVEMQRLFMLSPAHPKNRK